jgi:hypothetical protein
MNDVRTPVAEKVREAFAHPAGPPSRSQSIATRTFDFTNPLQGAIVFNNFHFTWTKWGLRVNPWLKEQQTVAN